MSLESSSASFGDCLTSVPSAARACVNCHKRKVRCDVVENGNPCTNCRSKNDTSCRLYLSKRQRQTLAGRKRSPLPLQPRLDEPVPLRQPCMRAGGSPQAARTRSRRRMSRSDASRPSSKDVEQDSNDDDGNLAEFISQEELREAAIDGRGRMCYIGTEVSNFNYLIRQSSLQSANSSIYHYRNRQFQQRHTAHDLQRVPREALERPDKALADELLRGYFVHVNRGWPIVDEELFMEQYEERNPAEPLALHLMNAVFLVGAHVLTTQRSDAKALQAVFFRRAKTLIDYRFEQDRLSYVQAALLMTWYTDGLEEIVANAWHWLGIAARTALGLGMHRDAERSRMYPAAKRTWIRVWWVLFQFDTMISASYGRPQALNVDECDVQDLEHRHFVGIPGAEIDFVTQHSKLCIIISRTARQRWALRLPTTARLDATRQGDEALARFMMELPPSLRLPQTSANIWTSTLHLSYNNFLILLHRPTPRQVAPMDAPESLSDTSICADAAMAVTSILENLHADRELPKLWLYGVHALFTAIIHVCNELQSPSPLVAVKSWRQFESLLASLRELSKYWHFALGLLKLYEERALRTQQNKASSSTTQPAGNRAEIVAQHLQTEALPATDRHQPSQQSQRDALIQHASIESTNIPAQGEAPALRESSQSQFDQEDFIGDPPVMTMGTDIWLDDMSFPDDSALEHFLATLGGQDEGFVFGL